MRYGYARVSSNTQDYAAQVEALRAAGCERIFSEKKSGKSAQDRPEFGKLMRAVLPGDTIVVTKLDRLARSSRDLHNVLHELEERSYGFVSLGEMVRHHHRRGQAGDDDHGRHRRVRARPDPKAL